MVLKELSNLKTSVCQFKIMHMKYNKIQSFILVIMISIFLGSCTPGGDFAGREYMPDMAHSTAYEANVITYYDLNTWGGEAELRHYSFARMPVKGAVARGKSIYYYGDNEAERTRAMTEIIDAKYDITNSGITEGKELFNIYCAICHGEKADGDGYLVREDGGVYPAQPANLVSEDFINSTNGRFYHALMYGKNVMSGYADKLSFEERWNVIHYIRSLQAKVKGATYNENSNTLNSWAKPGSMLHEEMSITVEVYNDSTQNVLEISEEQPSH